MTFRNSILALMFTFTLVLSVLAQSQTRNQTATPCRINPADVTEPVLENCKKMEIKAAEKEYEELIKNGEEAAKLSEELNASLDKNKSLTSEDSKKLVRLEKLVKKIRNNIGAEDEDEDKDEIKPQSLISILKNLQDKAGNLLSELKKTTRHSISVVAIESSNAVMKLVKILRFKS